MHLRGEVYGQSTIEMSSIQYGKQKQKTQQCRCVNIQGVSGCYDQILKMISSVTRDKNIFCNLDYVIFKSTCSIYMSLNYKLIAITDR